MKRRIVLGMKEKLALESLVGVMAGSGCLSTLIAAIEAIESGGQPSIIFLKKRLSEMQKSERPFSHKNSLLNPASLNAYSSVSLFNGGSIVMRPKIKILLSDAGTISKHIPAVKEALRVLVKQKGGVSEVAKIMGKAQSNLSRFLNGPGLRMDTIYKLAAALNVIEIEIDA